MTAPRRTGWWDTESWLRPPRAHRRTCSPLTARQEISSPWLLASTGRWVWTPPHRVPSCILNSNPTEVGVAVWSSWSLLLQWLWCVVALVVLIHSGRWNWESLPTQGLVFTLCNSAQLKDVENPEGTGRWINWHLSSFCHGKDKVVYVYSPF